MGGFDSYCFICGGHAHVVARLREELERDVGIPFPNVSAPFRFDASDEAFHTDLVSIGPYDESTDEDLIDIFKIYRRARAVLPEEVERLQAIDIETIRMIRGLVPGDNHMYGSIERRVKLSHVGRSDRFSINAAVYPFGHALCFELLKTWRPRVMNPVGVFWKTVCATNGVVYASMINGVDYGDISGSLEQYVCVLHGYGYGAEEKFPPQLVQNLAKEENDVDTDVLEDWWIGAGRLYCWVRPDKFPIAEARNNPFVLTSFPDRSQAAALAALPLDILLELSSHLTLYDILALFTLCTSLRLKLVPVADTLVRRSIPEWMRPDNSDGDSESFPWLAYARECSRSPSMCNRKRIWRVCYQIEALAVQHGVLPA
ncbi:hypothetical protein EXIGLDRAFT_162613 [Exidia glandulosa HHB12029]|uniref:F-box domain-containing protein n=1 Tax=Exidia glandulosa HHB12029 TaxID=1314781 RepID=A0A165FET4_EXIGL|nr:hypothetical protein EXIGLDRAFT_162613 [Exidia glandulosa HHB12029]